MEADESVPSSVNQGKEEAILRLREASTAKRDPEFEHVAKVA